MLNSFMNCFKSFFLAERLLFEKFEEDDFGQADGGDEEPFDETQGHGREKLVERSKID